MYLINSNNIKYNAKHVINSNNIIYYILFLNKMMVIFLHLLITKLRTLVELSMLYSVSVFQTTYRVG